MFPAFKSDAWKSITQPSDAQCAKIGDPATESLNFSRLISERSGGVDDVSSVSQGDGSEWVAQEILGHSHLSTPADSYLRVDQHAMVTALKRAKANTERAKKHHSWPSAKAAYYAFDYDDEKISELERTIAQASAVSLHGQTLTGTILENARPV
jgi:hypothetical protein